jgi:hypothetical protein
MFVGAPAQIMTGADGNRTGDNYGLKLQDEPECAAKSSADEGICDAGEFSVDAELAGGVSDVEALLAGSTPNGPPHTTRDPLLTRLVRVWPDLDEESRRWLTQRAEAVVWAKIDAATAASSSPPDSTGQADTISERSEVAPVARARRGAVAPSSRRGKGEPR